MAFLLDLPAADRSAAETALHWPGASKDCPSARWNGRGQGRRRLLQSARERRLSGTGRSKPDTDSERMLRELFGPNFKPQPSMRRQALAGLKLPRALSVPHD